MATFVKAPVATTQAVPAGVAKSAVAIAARKGSVRAGTRGTGRRCVPSRPDSPSMGEMLVCEFIRVMGGSREGERTNGICVYSWSGKTFRCAGVDGDFGLADCC